MTVTAALAQDALPTRANFTRGEQAAIAAGFVDLGGSSGQFLYAPFGAYKIGTLWESTKMKVCWNDPGSPSVTIRKIVRAAVAESWSKHVNIQFVGWENCTDTLDPDIRMQVAKTISATNGVGKDLRLKNPGMLLRVDYSDSPECKVKDVANPNFCLRANVIHEFGHALGLTHENLRQDAPDWCKEHQFKEDNSGPSPDGTVGKPDEYSIMNYCNPTSLNDGNLSAGDIDTIKKLYSGQI